MSEVVLFKSGLPAYLQNQQDETTKALAGSLGIKRISIKGGSFRLYDGGQEIAVSEDRHLDVVIVAAAPHVSRTFYSKTYKEGEKISPDCWSSDGVKPDANVNNPQCDNCMGCKMNIKEAEKGRPCRFNQRIAVVLANDIPGPVYQVVLPAQSIFGKDEVGKMPLQQYAKWVAGHGAPITAVVTRMKFDVNSATPKLTFGAQGPLSEEDYLIAKAKGQTPEAQNAIRLNMSQADGVDTTERTPESIANKAKEVVQNSLTEVQEAPVQEKVAAPTSRKNKTTPPVVPETKDVASLLEEWDD